MSDNYETRMKRIQDAIDLKESDRVPWAPYCQGFVAFHSGMHMKDIVYDMDKAKTCFINFANDYQPDMMLQLANDNVGMGPIWEKLKMKNLAWAGEPSHRVSDDSIHQFLEEPILKDDEMEEFTTDFTGYLLSKGFGRVAGVFDPMADWKLNRVNPTFNSVLNIATALSTPASRQMINEIWEIGDMVKERSAKFRDIENTLENMGYPVLDKGGAAVPFDRYSDIYRGTMDSMMDLYDNEEVIVEYCRQNLKIMKEQIKEQGKFLKGKWVFMALHKGMDGFMSNDQYKNYYWDDLLEIIELIVDCGMVPYIFTEGKYNTRLDFLKDVPKGKCVIHIEDCDLKQVKKKLGGVACVDGGLPATLLEQGTEEQVRDTCKEALDIMAPGGGFIFSTTGGMDKVKPGLLEAAMDVVLNYK